MTSVQVAIHSIETVVPTTRLAQSEIRDLLVRQPGIGGLGRRMIRSAFDAAAIDSRYTVLPELAPDWEATEARAGMAFRDPATGWLRPIPTGHRNDVYRGAAGVLFVAAAKQALAAAPEMEPADVTHVITVSCTGFYAPGPDIEIVRALGLEPTVQRSHIGFMGCYAAFPALRAAADFCRADTEAVVLVVAVELCTLHLHSADDSDTILSSSLFADGGAAAVVSARPAAPGATVLEIDRFASTLIAEGDSDMAWTIGNEGFEMVLSGQVPRLVETHVRQALEPLLGPGGDGYPQVDRWAVHPGGRSILERTTRGLGLPADALDASREVLRRFGNMSSATVLFVLSELLQEPAGPPARVCALAFGPGISVESALLTLRTAS